MIKPDFGGVGPHRHAPEWHAPGLSSVPWPERLEVPSLGDRLGRSPKLNRADATACAGYYEGLIGGAEGPKADAANWRSN